MEDSAKTITIPVAEYNSLIEKADKIKTFERYVNKERYSITREMCGIFFDFEVTDNESD